MPETIRRIKTSMVEYAAAVAELVEVAQQPTSGGSIAAQLLLSAYDGYNYQANIGALHNLDSKNFELAATVFTGRYDTGMEPHQVIKNGNGIFQSLKQQWRHLHVEERGKKVCPVCEGTGRMYLSEDEDDRRSKVCCRCEGTGRICWCEAPPKGGRGL